MRKALRRELWFLRAYVIASGVLLALLSTSAFSQSTQTFGEINVARINVKDADGTLRMVISNKDRMHPGVMDGVTIERPRPVAGMLFFNDEGDEVGASRIRAGHPAPMPASCSTSSTRIRRSASATRKLMAVVLRG